MRDSHSAVLLGASGLVGGFCLQALLADSDFSQVTVLGRRELAGFSQPKLRQKIVSFDNLAPDDFAGATAILCALGTTMRKAGSKEAFRRVDLEYPLSAAKAARQAGATQFVLVSSVGADPASRNFYLRTKGELEQQLAALGFPALHIFRPSMLLGKRQEFRFGERLIAAISPALNLPLIGSWRRYRAIPAETVGKAMPAAAKKGSAGVFLYHYDEIRALVSQP